MAHDARRDRDATGMDDGDMDSIEEDEGADVGRPRKTLTTTIAARFTPEEAEVVRRVAQARGLSASDVIRDAVKTAYTQTRPPIDQTVVTQVYDTGPRSHAPQPKLQYAGDFRAGSAPRTGR